MERLPQRITTPRLLLRRWMVEDVPTVRAAVEASVEHLKPWLAFAALEPLGDDDRLALLRSWQEDWERGGDAVYGVFLHPGHDGDGPGGVDPGVAVGGCGLHRRRGAGILEIGYWIHVDHVRQGYATELARGLTTAAFAVDGVDRVEIHHDKANTRSGAVPRSLGFDRGPEQPDKVAAPGEIGIDCTWSIDRTTWSETGPKT